MSVCRDRIEKHHERRVQEAIALVLRKFVELQSIRQVLAHIVLHDHVAAAKALLAAQPVAHPLDRVALLARPPTVLLKRLVEKLGEPNELRPLDHYLAPIPRRLRKAQHLPHALAGCSEMPRRPAVAHPLPARHSYLAIQLHGVNPPGPPRRRKGPYWQSLTPLRRGRPDATVGYSCTATYNWCLPHAPIVVSPHDSYPVHCDSFRRPPRRPPFGLATPMTVECRPNFLLILISAQPIRGPFLRAKCAFQVGEPVYCAAARR